MTARAIPQFTDMTGWDHIRINQRDEKLIFLSHLSGSGRMIIAPAYYRSGIPGAINDVLLREQAAELLVQAASRLPDGYKFVLYDGWRPVSVQTHLYNEFEARLRQEHPELAPDELAELVKKFVSLPSTNPDRPSPHLTGGSIDLGLVNAYGDELDMGTPFDDFTDVSETAYYESRDVSGTETVYRDNRRLLYYALTDVGFTNYHKEWWHYDYGNQFWARTSGAEEAFYGVASIEEC